MGILATATFRINHLAGCPLMSDKDLKREGRGSFDYRIAMNSTLRVVKWHDNKAVTVASNLEELGLLRLKSEGMSNQKIMLTSLILVR